MQLLHMGQELSWEMSIAEMTLLVIISGPSQSNYQARALRALGLLLADGTPTVGGGKTF